jgi:Na+/proline symporter
MFPSFDLSTPESRDVMISIFMMPLAVQWWSAWYPGAEPGGGGYIAQRMLAAKDERHATGATLLFNAAHYALRPWPWIIVALASLIVFPDLESLGKAFPQLPEEQVKHDLAYPAMLTFLPPGMLGLVVASLAAAYMSTISTHLNWGSSYVVNDFWKRFLRPAASERELVRVGRISTVAFMVLAGALATVLENAKQGFDILIQIGMGTGLLFILRWFWWRINPYSEIAAMVVSFGVAFWMAFAAPEDMPSWAVRLAGLGVTTAAWVLVTFLTPPDRPATLRAFYRQIHPGGPGWQPVLDQAARDGEPLDPAGEGSAIGVGLVCMLAGCAAVYSALFATGYWLYGRTPLAVTFTVIAIATSGVIAALWGRLNLAGDDASPAAADAR